MRTQILIAFGCVLAACGGDDGGKGGADSAPVIDTPPAIDAPAAKQIGSACTPDQNNPTGPGDCGAGFTCLALQGGSGPFCTKTCTQGTGDTCPQSFTGKGMAQCILGVQPAGGGATMTFCGIICSTVDATQCPNCDGTCPAPLQCNAPLQNAQMQVVAQACK